MYNITIVSAFLSNINNNKKIEKYIEWSKILININLPKIIFIEQEIYNKYFNDESYPNTKFIIIKRSDLYLYKYYDKITNFNIQTDNPNKDTIDYLFVQCNKTEWVREAILLNYYKTDQFIWLDFSIYHVIKDISLFENEINSLNNKLYNNVRIPGCWNPNNEQNYNVYNTICWYFSGGIFGGNKDKLIDFANLTREKCINVINEKNNIIWEVNIWYLIYKDNPELFSYYYGNHDLTILSNY